jgi:hypothetical protein
LPPEIVTKILSNLCTFDLLHNVSRVSKLFYELSKSPASHRDVFLSCYVNQNKAAEFLKTTTLIENLEINLPSNV